MKRGKGEKEKKVPHKILAAGKERGEKGRDQLRLLNNLIIAKHDRKG